MVSLFTRLARFGARAVPEAITRFPGNGPDLYPSFDDGPGQATPQFLDVLDELGVNVTFFFCGAQIRQNPELVRRASAAGHTIGSHGFAHLNAWAESAPRSVQDLKQGVECLREVLGREVAWIRPPQGRVRRATLKWVSDQGLKLALWDVDTRDYRAEQTPEGVHGRIVKESRPGSIVLMHENGLAWTEEHPAGTCIRQLVKDGFHLFPFPEDWFSVDTYHGDP